MYHHIFKGVLHLYNKQRLTTQYIYKKDTHKTTTTRSPALAPQ